MDKLREYLLKMALERQETLGRRISSKEEAHYIGVTPTTYSSWINGYSYPSGDNLRKIAKRYGNEIYVLVGQEPPSVIEGLEYFPPKLQSATLEIRETLSKYNISGDSEEAERVVIEILTKHGYKINKPDDSSS